MADDEDDFWDSYIPEVRPDPRHVSYRSWSGGLALYAAARDDIRDDGSIEGLLTRSLARYDYVTDDEWRRAGCTFRPYGKTP